MESPWWWPRLAELTPSVTDTAMATFKKEKRNKNRESRKGASKKRPIEKKKRKYQSKAYNFLSKSSSHDYQHCEIAFPAPAAIIHGFLELEGMFKAGPPPPPPLEAILVIFGRRALIFFSLKDLGKK